MEALVFMSVETVRQIKRGESEREIQGRVG